MAQLCWPQTGSINSLPTLLSETLRRSSLFLGSLGQGFKRALLPSPPALSQHNSGFYGHFRGQVKSESAGEYRFAAKPPPPAVFLQRCEVQSVPRAVGWKGPSLPLMRPQERHLSPCRERLTRQAPGNSLPLGQQEVWNLVLEIRDLYQKVRDDQAPKWTVLFMDPSG